MWFWRKKAVRQKAVEVRQKRKPREWSIPKEHAIEVIGLYDEMLNASRFVDGIGFLKTRHLPRYLFWQKLLEVVPEVKGCNIRIEPVNDSRCIKIIENVPDGEFEPDCADKEKVVAETQRVFEELEHKLDLCKPISPGANQI